MIIEEKHFGFTSLNQEVRTYILKNEFLEVEILNYGGIIRKIMTPNKNGNFENIVLGFDNIEDYEKKIGIHFGAIVGRNAGRIKDGLLIINKKIYKLERNNGNNNLHGYPEYYAAKIWNVEKKIDKDKLSLILTRISPHLEANFPGEINLKVVYTLNKNILEIDYEGIPDRDTYMNLTNHSYFNLSGDLKERIDNQLIELDCDEYIQVDKSTLPIKISKVENTIMDLRKGKRFSEIFNSNEPQIKIVGNGLDHPFIFNKKNDIVAKFTDEKSGRIMKVVTDQPVGVIYTGNYVKDAGILSGNIKSENHMGFCIETQDYPDVIKFLPRKAKLYTKNNGYKQKTKFIFELK